MDAHKHLSPWASVVVDGKDNHVGCCNLLNAGPQLTYFESSISA